MGEVAYKLELPQDCLEDMMYFMFHSWRSATQRWLTYRWEIQYHWKQFSWTVIWPMRRNQLRFLSMPTELPAVRLSSFAKFRGATTRRMKPPGSERKICPRTTLTYFLANPNLEGEIHLKGGRFVTSQIFNLECYALDHQWISYFICFWVLILEILRNSRPHGESWGFRYFHIWVLSNFENRIIWFYLFYHQLFLLQKYERGNKMTFPK